MFSNISGRKDNQTIKLGQFIEHNMRNIFRQKLCTKCGRKIIPRHFSKKSNQSASLDQ